MCSIKELPGCQGRIAQLLKHRYMTHLLGDGQIINSIKSVQLLNVTDFSEQAHQLWVKITIQHFGGIITTQQILLEFLN